MRKGISVLLVFCLFALMAVGSGPNSSSDNRKNIEEVESDTKNIEEVESDGEDQSKDLTDVAEDYDTEAETNNIPVIEEQIVFEQDGIRVTAVEYEVEPIWGDSIKFLVENETDRNIIVSTEEVIINDYMVTDYFYADVAAGKKANESLSLSSSELNAAGISKIGKIEVYFSIYDADSYDDIAKTDCITIDTNLKDTMDEKIEEDGIVLYEDGEFKIVGKYVDESSFWGAAVMIYIENKSNKNVVVSVEDVSVNGFMVTSFLYQTVYSGKMAYEDITLFESDLEDNNIESVEEIALKFEIYEEDTYNTLVNTDEIVFSINN